MPKKKITEEFVKCKFYDFMVHLINNTSCSPEDLMPIILIAFQIAGQRILKIKQQERLSKKSTKTNKKGTK